MIGPRTLQRVAHLAAFALFLGCESAPPPSTLLDEGVSLELAQLRAATIQDLRYEVHLAIPELREAPIEGRMTLRFLWDDPDANPLVLDFQNPGDGVRALRVNGAEAAFEAVANHVVVRPELLAKGRENEVDIEFVAGDGSLNRNDAFLYTLFVPARAHEAIPLFDQPDLKGRFTLSLELPEGWVAVANGASRTPDEPGDPSLGTTLRFAETEPISTYLFGFAAGEFRTATATRAGREMTLYYRETDDQKVARNLPAIFDLHGTALEWLEEYTEIPYPFGKFDFVAVPSFQYGGMEHPGAILYRESSLFLDESATQGQELGRASLIAHETAHMWFGDLVTMRWFDDVWTKEVFANFMAAKIVNPSFPQVNHDLRFFLAHHSTAYGVDRTAGANPIRQPLENLNDAGSLYGAIIYQKAPIVMRQLEGRVGEERFREGMREYLATHAFGNATWPDLIAILDRLVPEDLAAWSRVWVEEAGRPTVTASVDLAPDGTVANFRLRQDDPTGAGRVWPQILAPALGYGDSVVVLTATLSESEVGVPAAAGLPAPDFVIPDALGLGYARFRLDSASRDYLLTHLPAQRDPLTRGVAFLTLYEGVLEGEVEPAAFGELALQALPMEADEQNLARTLGYLGTVADGFLSDERREELASRLESVLWDGMLAASTSTARATWFGGWRSLVRSQEGIVRLEAIWRGEEVVQGVPLSENDRIAMALQLALQEVPGWKAILDEQAEAIGNPDSAARFSFLRPSVDADPAVREAFFETLKDPVNRAREPWTQSGLANLSHGERAEHALRFIEPGLDLVQEIQRTGDIFFPLGWVNALLSGHHTPAAADIVDRWIAAHPDYPPRLMGKILQGADGTNRAAAIR